MRKMLLAVMLIPFAVHAVTLEQIISRESPKFNCAAAVMTVGQDGKVYLSSIIHNGGYILRVSRDGEEKLGGDAVYAMANATANAEGIIASANAHFNHSVNLYDQHLNRYAACSGFLNNDQVGWNSPTRVEAGASGDFYGMEYSRQRILRIDTTGKVLQAYEVPEKSKDFRVCEATQAFFVRIHGDPSVYCIGFDGATRWKQEIRGLYTVDAAGMLYVLEGNLLKTFSPGGEPAGEIKLQGLKRVTAIEVFGDELIVKHADPTELFQVHALATGELIRVVHSDHERFSVEVPSLIWTAGDAIPLTVNFTGPGAPQWRIWITPLGDTDWRELAWENNQVSIPMDCAGLYQLKVAPALNPQALPDTLIREVIEVRAPDSQGTVSMWTPLNRIWFGRGEEIPLEVVLRSAETNANVTATFSFGEWSTRLDLTPNTVSTFTIPAAVTEALAPGRYAVVSEVAGFTCVPQPIRIGPGLAARSPFRVTRHGDYRAFVSGASVWDFADTADDMLAWSQAMGVNQFINRIFAGMYPLSFANNQGGLKLLHDLGKRLDADPAGVAPQKVAFGFPHAHTVGAWGAAGVREMLLLLPMDAPLPIGTSVYYQAGQSPEKWAETTQTYTKPLRDLPGFYGWVWVANWWITDPNLRFVSPEQKTEYAAAIKEANETGTWNPVLDEVGDRKLNWQSDAQEVFGNALEEVAPGRVTASSGPYRRPEVYPPTSFANVDEVDLHFQAEQITTPNWTAHAPDFYKRPGKPAWMHPELWNDSGTGEQILPMTWLGIMRGVDGIGNSGDAKAGTHSVFSALNTFAEHYGPWLMTLENADHIAIPVSRRQIKADDWGGVGGRYFTRLWEAYMSCLYARKPATFIFTEDKPDLSRFKALLLVGQRFEPEPALAELLAQAQQLDLPIFADGTCRETLTTDYLPLGITFDRIEKLHGFNHDEASWEFRDALLAQAPLVAEALSKVVEPVGTCDLPEVLLSERRQGDARFVWVVNNTFTALDPGLLWRLQPAVATHTPIIAQVTLPVKKGEVVYDVFSGTEVSGRTTGDKGPEVHFEADLRYSYARVYAILPRKIKKLKLRRSGKVAPGETIEWAAKVPGIKSPLPLHLALRDGEGSLIEERFTTTGSGTLTVPVNVARPVELSATELIAGTSSLRNPTPDDQGSWIADDLFGPRLRGVAIAPDGQTALLNAYDWEQNLYTLDLATGKMNGSKQVGDYFASTPVATPAGFAIQGYDLGTGEGYHLYTLDAAGDMQRRFALPGLPARMSSWNTALPFRDSIRNFELAPDGSWIAGAGNLALAVWDPDGALLWSQDWAATDRQIARLLVLGNDTLVVAKGTELTAYEARTGRELWMLTPDPAGKVTGMSASKDGRTIAVSSSSKNGRVFVVRDGKRVGTLPTGASETAVTSDGEQVVVATGREIKYYQASGGLEWVYKADSTLSDLRLSPDGTQFAVGSELGLLHVFDLANGSRQSLDLGAQPIPAWLPDGDLLYATWMGTVVRLDRNLNEKWRIQLEPSPTSSPQTADLSLPTTRLTSWSNAEATPLPLTPNLMSPNAVIVRAMQGNRGVQLQNPMATLFDGLDSPPAQPWMTWHDISMNNSGWRGSFSLEIDTFRTQLRVTAITFVEDAAHPESWMRDAQLEYWDPRTEQWVFAQYLTSDAAVHTHKLTTPIEAAKFRLVPSYGQGWPASNLRLAEIVFHGESLGASHPDVVANNPVAVLFDEKQSDLMVMKNAFNPQFEFRNGGAASGGTFLALKAEGQNGVSWQPPFGHAVPDWDFEIVETPEKPGQYRWLQFAYKALAPETRGVTMLIGPNWPGGGVTADMGEPWPYKEGFWVRKQITDKPATEWTVVTVDLWGAVKKDFRIRGLSLAAIGGPAGFDRILLTKTNPSETSLENPNEE